MALLIDTSIFVDLDRQDESVDSVLARFDDLAIASITAAELIRGAHGAKEHFRPKHEAFVETVLAMVPMLPLDARVARALGQLLATLDRRGQPIGAYDAIVAATALAHGRDVLAADARSFPRVPGLKVTLVSSRAKKKR